MKIVKDNLWFILIIIFASVLYLLNINFSDIWIDEAFSKALVRHSFVDVAGLIKNDFHPPLYFFGLKIFVTIFGLTNFTIRLFSVLGMLATIVLGYVVGQRVFAKSGALYLSLLIISLPMFAEYSHEARMYTWSVFSVLGAFLYAVLFLKTKTRSDLLFLMIFSLMAAYTHYYALLAAFWANVFVLISLLINKNKNLKVYSIYSLVTALLYLPWLLVMLNQTKKVLQSFWVPAIDWQVIQSCFLSPFAPKIYLPPFLPLAIVFYTIVLWVIYRTFKARKENQRTILGLALTMFGGTILLVIIISLLIQPILFMRYLVNIIVLLLVPVTLFFMSIKNNWAKGIILTIIMIFGIGVSIRGSFFSYGPYEHTLEYIHQNYPEVNKIFHLTELTAGPFAEYSYPVDENYWYCTDSTIVYTNMDVFDNLISTNSLSNVLQKDESFCFVEFPYSQLNQTSLKQIFSETNTIGIDTVVDNKVNNGVALVLYKLKYKGSEN